jgi:hypothetical protein
VDVLDTQKLIVFNGVPAFIATLVGLITLNKYHEIDEKVLVRVFKHPVLGIEGYDYSFAILIRAHSSTADHSGWLIFFDCATDYSGLGGSLYEMANAFIKKFKRDGSVEVKEILVDKEIFKEYLAERSSSPIFTDFSISELQKEMENFMGQVKGKLLEYVFYKWINEKYVIIGKVYNKVQCDFWIQGEQIDCIAERDNKIDVFECKISLHDDQIDETIKQIKRKAEIIKNEYKKNVSPHIVVYNAQPEHISKIEKEGINVIQFKDKIAYDANREQISIFPIQ